MQELFFSEHATWFTIPAIVGTFFFLLRMTLMLIGAHLGDLGLDGHHGDLAMHADAHHGDPGEAFKLLSIQSIAAFLMGFGWGGLGGLRGADWSWTNSILCGLASGGVMVWLLAMGLRALVQMQSSGTVSIQDALGAEGDVYTTVPERGLGSGQVKVVIDNRQRIYNAISGDGSIASNARVRVVGVNPDNTLTVMPGTDH